MSDAIETFRGVIFPWQCDQMGHMNVQFYTSMFDQGTMHLLSMAGFTWDRLSEASLGFADVRHVVEYKAEQGAGNLIVVHSAITRLGNSSITLAHQMKNPETGALAATSEVTCVFFDLKARKSVPIPDDLRASAQAYVIASGD